jgi:cell division protein FtsQ
LTATRPAPRPVRVPMDPRIRARRAAVRRDEGRRRLRMLVSGLVVASAIGVAVALVDSPWFSVQHVTVEGNRATPTAAIVAASGLCGAARPPRCAGPPLVALDAAGAARRVERLPFVAHASVLRRWPDGVLVVVREHRGVAVAKDRRGFALVDREGEILATAGAPWPGFVRLAGVVADGAAGSRLPRAADAALRVAAGLPEALRGEVAAVRSDAGGVELELSGGGVVQLGGPDRLAAKLDALVALLRAGGIPQGAVADLRVPEVPTVTPGSAGGGSKG